MTLDEIMDKENTLDKRSNRKMKSIGYILMTSLKHAIRRGRLFCGMTPCAQLLSSEASTIMLCVLPDHCNQESVLIHHTLIKAFCHEKRIPIIQLKNHHSIEHLIQKIRTKDRHCDLKGDVTDMSCFLIKHSAKGTIKEDNMLIQFTKEMMAQGQDDPLVDLPA